MLNIKKYYFKEVIGGGLGLLLLFYTTLFAINFVIQNRKNNQVENIAIILREHALTYDIDQRSVDTTLQESLQTPLIGFDTIQAKITAAVANNKPIELNLVGFPYKSQNTTKKVLVPHLDAAEKHSLDYLNSFLNKIAAVYAPGANLTIFTDGTVFCDIEEVDDSVVVDYEKQLKRATVNMHHIHIKTLTDLLPGKTHAEIRTLIQNIPPTTDEFEALLISDTQLQEEITLLEKRMAFEFNHPAGLAKLQRTPIKTIAKKIVHRGLQYSTFLAAFRPKEAIRLSVHYQSNVSKKMGIKLSHNSFVTPWHGILVIDSNGIAHITHLEDTASIRRRA